jgi:protein-export membrane protein SecD
VIAVIIVLCAATLSVKTIELNNFERGGDTLLGLNLGLDLQGGSHLVYKATSTNRSTGATEAPSANEMASLVKTIERRINSSGLAEPIIQILGEDRLLIQLPGIKDPGRAKSLIGETAQLEFKHRKTVVDPEPIDFISTNDVVTVDIRNMLPDGTFVSDKPGSDGGTDENTNASPVVIIEFTNSAYAQFQSLALGLLVSYAQSEQAFQRGDMLPPSTLELAIEGKDPLRFSVTGNQIKPLENTKKYAFVIPSISNRSEESITSDEYKSKLGDNPTVSFNLKPGFIDEDIGLTGDDLTTAYPSQHQSSGAPIVNIEFGEEGTKKFGALTTKIYNNDLKTGVKDQIAIILDGQALIAPVVNSPITAGTAIIQGPDFTLERVKDLALLLESGRLPVPIELIQERDVDAILGADSLKKSVIAGGVGLLLVLLFMTLYYRVPGLVASFALLIYAGIVLTIFKLLPVTLTLSGVAAAILSLGMAVDANILIFERMKDELRAGRTMLSAINTGFNRAWPAIRDGNVSTLITCGILYWFADTLGATVVQGFAVTLAIGVVISMFSAIVISRTFMRVVALAPISKNLQLFIPSGGKALSERLTR